MAITYNTIEEALQDLRNGKCILVTDDPDRENEGDLICAGQFATTENVNLMASAAKGLICMPMSHDNIVRAGTDPDGFPQHGQPRKRRSPFPSTTSTPLPVFLRWSVV